MNQKIRQSIAFSFFTHLIGDESVSGVEADVFEGSPLILGEKPGYPEEIPAEISAATKAQFVPVAALVYIFHVSCADADVNKNLSLSSERKIIHRVYE